MSYVPDTNESPRSSKRRGSRPLGCSVHQWEAPGCHACWMKNHHEHNALYFTSCAGCNALKHQKEHEMAKPQNEDGTAHLAYYDKEHEISFVWNGSRGKRIDVCPGPYGEPADDSHEINLAFSPTSMSLSAALSYFAEDCKRWARIWCPKCTPKTASEHSYTRGTDE